ncbi:MAG TPA: elongation factor G, partial [bacterium (Candidatus Stahlbacteria)]|nr:elongation factor G [Candidatus Stahlbacteria bacterium]
DWMDQEKERGITITSAAITCFWHDYQINIIDTPGHVDFTCEVERALKVLDGGIIVLCGVSGVQPQTETVWRQADRYRVPRIIFVSKLDRIGADYFRVLDDIREKLSIPPLPIQYPIITESRIIGIIDLLRNVMYVWRDELGTDMVEEEIPEVEKDRAQEFREKLLETVVEHDDQLLERWLHGESITVDDVIQVIRRTTIGMKLVPVLCGSALKNRGIQPLLDAIINFLPSPEDIPPQIGFDPESGEEKSFPVDENGPFSALVFKIQVHPHIGFLYYLRAYSGRLKKGKKIAIIPGRRIHRPSKLLLMHSNRREEVETLSAGEIGAVVGIKECKTGYTLCDRDNLIAYEPMSFPEPVVTMAIEPKSSIDDEKLLNGLEFLTLEDPTFRFQVNEETGERIISGMGELHLEVLVERLHREFGVNCNVGKPQVAYHETVQQKAVGVGIFDRKVGDTSLFAEVELEVMPNPKAGIAVEYRVPDLRPEVKDWLKEAVLEQSGAGVIGGYPLIDIMVSFKRVSIRDNTNDVAIKVATSLAIRNAMEKADPAVMEPIMSLEVITPEDYLGEVINDINSRRGKIMEVIHDKKVRIIHAEVPLARFFGYATGLRSLTQGSGVYTLQFSHYQVCD